MEKKMQIDQFVELAAAVVQSLPRDMDVTTGQGWITNRYALAKMLRQALMPTATQKSFPTLLTPAGTTTVRPATNFTAHEFFQVNTEKNAPVKISYVGDNFKEWFLDKDASEVILRYSTLNKPSVDGPIIDDLGGEVKAETTPAEFAACMQKQANGEQGALLTNGYANIFYVRNVNGVLCAVRVHWSGDDWDVCAFSVERPSEWDAGRRVFSRDS